MKPRKTVGIHGRSARVRRVVQYVGRPFAPADDTYRGIDPMGLTYATRADSGITLDRTDGRAKVIHPLIAAALFEAGFATEMGPLTTWSN